MIEIILSTVRLNNAVGSDDFLIPCRSVPVDS